MKNEYPNFRGITQGFIVEVLEGEGTEENLSRIVRYVYDNDTNLLGVIDVAQKIKITDI